MLMLNRSPLNREYILINVLKALASIISMYNIHVTFLSNINVNGPSSVTSALNLLVLIYLLHVSAHRPSSERCISFSMKRTALQ
jgi:hypothetical protein